MEDLQQKKIQMEASDTNDNVSQQFKFNVN